MTASAPPATGGRRGLVIGIALTLVCVLALVLLVFRQEIFSSCSAQVGGPPVTLTGIAGSESVPLLADPEVGRCLAKAGITLAPPDSSGSLAMGLRNDLGRFQYAVPSSQPAADLLQQTVGDRGSVPLYTSPMVVATYREVADTLVAAHLATLGPDGQGTVDMAGLIDLIDRQQKWEQLRGNEVPGAQRAVLLSTTDPAYSNSAAMFLALGSSAENHDQLLTSTEQIGAVMPQLCPVFQYQGGDKQRSSQDLFNRYLGGIEDTPMALVYEHQFREAKNDDRLTSDQVVLYPTHTVVSQYTLVNLSRDPATAAAVDRLERELSQDPGIVERATELGYRPVQPPAGSSPEPQPAETVKPPNFPVLNELVDTTVRECQ